jgi:hypothetical protein
LELTDFEKIIMKLQNIGLEINELKNQGETQTSIENFENLLDSYIENMRRYELTFNELVKVYNK